MIEHGRSGDGSDPAATPAPHRKSRRWRSLGIFLYLWLMIGFVSGTLTLLGPTRWLKGALAGAGLERLEDYAMWGLIALFVAGSFVATRWLQAGLGRSHRGWLRVGVPLVLTGLAAGALVAWSNPARLAGLAGGREERISLASGAEMVFGPYPDRARLEQLRRDGFVAVISLQHPAVVPIEPQGIEAERKAAGEIGIQFIHAPMLPWVSDNAASLDAIRHIAESGTGKYYVHCGLGRDRVNVVRAMVERMGKARVVAAADLETPRTFADRVAEGRFLMERGNFQILDDDVWLVPWPNQYEGFGKTLSGQVEQIVVVMDPQNPEQAGWMVEAEKLFGAYGVPYRIVAAGPGDHSTLLETARAVRQGARPAVVLIARTRPCRDTAEAEAFLEAWEQSGGRSRAEIQPGDGDPHAEVRPLPCEGA